MASKAASCAPETTSFGNAAGGQLVERDLGLPGATFDDERARALGELGRQRGRRVQRRADRLQEAAEECLRIVRRSVGPPAPAVLGEPCDRRIVGDARRGRLDHRQ